MNLKSRVIPWGIGLGGTVLATLVIVVGYLAARPAETNRSRPESPERADVEDSGKGIPVKAIHPKSDPSFSISVQQLLTVEPFFEAGLRSEVAGPVRYVHKAIGDRVKVGELLVELDVPHLWEDVAAKDAIVRQRQRDVQMAEAQVNIARANVEVARYTIDLRKTEVFAAGYTRDFRKTQWGRYMLLQKKDAVLQNIVDEEQRNYLAAEAAYTSAEVAVKKATADFQEKESELKAAQTDVELKESMVEVARKQRDQARALAGYSQITAPFDGVITERNVDVGTFVQNASSGQSQPVMRVARTDLVTVTMKVPDNAAPYVTRGTVAVIQIDELPGVVIRGVVTRFAPSIHNQDRTMRVEVDLFNEGREKYNRFLAKSVGTWLSPVGAAGPLSLTGVAAAARSNWDLNSKGAGDPLPIFGGSSDSGTALLPGMSGYMRLNLKQFRGASLVPSSAVYTKGGKPYILTVQDGKSAAIPVRVQMDDGKVAKVLLITQEADPGRNLPEILREITPQDTVILNRQVEIGAGRAVAVTLENW